MLSLSKNIFRILLLLILVGLFAWFAFDHREKFFVHQQTPAILEQLHRVQNLETATMSINTLVAGEKDIADTLPRTAREDSITNILFQDEIRMEVHGTVTAGFDLSLLQTGDIAPVGNNLLIRLPSPTILHVIVEDDTSVYHRNRGFFTKGDPQLESMVRKEARSMLRQLALSGGILTEAKGGSEDAVASLLGESRDITIAFDERMMQ